MTKQWRILFALIFVLIIVLFSIANVETVTFGYLFGSVRMPLILVIIISMLVGALMIGVFTYSAIYRQRRRISKLERELRRIADLHPEDSAHIDVTGDMDSQPRTPTSRLERRSKK